MAKVIKARLVWTPSVSAGVVEQHLIVNVNDVEIANVVLEPTVTEFPLTLAELDHVVARLDCFDGTHRSSAVDVDTTLPDLTPPEAPTNLGLVIDSVEDVE